MRTLHVIMPMAGEGRRFMVEGIVIPKPLIKIKDQFFFEKALQSILSIRCAKKYSFVVREEHIKKDGIDSAILQKFPEAHIYSVAKTTRGAVETCLLATPAMDPDDGVLVLDCDLEFSSEGFNCLIEQILSLPAGESNGGVLVSFPSNDPRYSFALTDENNRVLRTAEKEVISENALAGAYFFSKGSSFLEAGNLLMNEINFCKPEYYISLLYNYLIKNGEQVLLAKTDTYHSFGTPEELAKLGYE